MNLTLKQQKVLEYLRSCAGWVSPAEVGINVGGRNSRGRMRYSSWGSPICKRLVELGLAERNRKGHYRALQV